MDIFQEFSFEDVIRIAIAGVVILASLLSMLYIIWGGFLMIISGGNEEKIKPAVNHIRHAIIGFVFLIGVLFIFPVIMRLLGLSYGEYTEPRAIFATISELFGTVLSDNSVNVEYLPPSDTLPDNFSSDF